MIEAEFAGYVWIGLAALIGAFEARRLLLERGSGRLKPLLLVAVCASVVVISIVVLKGRGL